MTKEQKEKKDIKERIEKFQNALGNERMSDESIVGRYITYGIPFIFRDDEDVYFQLKEEVAGLYPPARPSSVNMVGSAKLGFSIKPSTLFKPISLDSDIDIAIINKDLFDNFWREVLEYTNTINKSSRTEEQDNVFDKFREYFFKGWIRPDLFPYNIPQKEWYLDVRTELYNKYDNRKVSIGFFREEYFLEYYHLLNIKKIRQSYGK